MSNEALYFVGGLLAGFGLGCGYWLSLRGKGAGVFLVVINSGMLVFHFIMLIKALA